jgi:hypothetical protein
VGDDLPATLRQDEAVLAGTDILSGEDTERDRAQPMNFLAGYEKNIAIDYCRDIF